MVKIVRLPIIAVVLSLVPVMAQAQGRTPRTDSAAVGFDIGLFKPNEDVLNATVSLDGFYEYYLSPRTSVRFGLGYIAPDYEFEQDETLRYISVGGDVIYNWEGGAVHPFVGAGVGVYIMQPRENGNDVAESESKLGVSVLGGLEYFTSNTVALKGEASYHFISDVDNFGPRNPNGLKLSIGLKKYF